MAGGCRKLHDDEIRNLYTSSNIIRVIKSRRMRLSRHVARTEDTCIQGFSRKTWREETTRKTWA